MIPTLRDPLPADYDALATWVPDARACMRWAGPRVSFPFSAAGLPAQLAVAGGQSSFLDEGDGSPAGFGQHWVATAGAVHLGRVIVAPAMRGWGLGVVLCRLLMAQAVARTGASEVTLRVYRDNLVALRTYTGLGFVPVEAESDVTVLFMKASLGTR
ncbi:MAG TPA: GNAT family protein [Ideonella sp.]|nr:GNAT family protein [Ideonella sp.]